MGSGKGNNPLDTINAAEAYAQGYTGKGVTLGIVDDYVNLSHSEFASKDNSYVIGKIPGIDAFKEDARELLSALGVEAARTEEEHHENLDCS